MIEVRKVSRQAQDYPSPDALVQAYEAGVVRSFADFTAQGHSWVWCLVGNIVQEHEYGESHELRRGTKQFSSGTKVFLAPSAWGDGYEKIVVIGMPRGCRHYIEVITYAEYIENFRMQKVYKSAVLKRMCGSAYRWWGDLDADRDEIAEYLKSRSPQMQAEEMHDNGNDGEL